MLAISDIVIGEVFSENVTMQETVTLNTQDQKRVMVLNRILDGQVSSVEAAALLKLSKRQVQRILATYRKEGAAALVHGNRGRSPKHRAVSEADPLEEQLAGRQAPSQFGRLLEELETTSLEAPQLRARGKRLRLSPVPAPPRPRQTHRSSQRPRRASRLPLPNRGPIIRGASEGRRFDPAKKGHSFGLRT